jgi:DNA repair protein RecO (recombination protein O)
MYSQRAIVLHLVPYRESSVIVRLLTENAGKISGIYRGVRGNKRKSKAVVQPLYSGVVEYLGKPDLFTISNFEANRYPALTGEGLYSGLYVAELLVKLLGEGQGEEQLLEETVRVIKDLETNIGLASKLRRFEFRLMEILGYGVDFTCEAVVHEAINPEGTYVYVDQVGFVRERTDGPLHGAEIGAIPGIMLQRFARGDFSGEAGGVIAKRISRTALSSLMGNKTLSSRKIFRSELTPDSKD